MAPKRIWPRSRLLLERLSGPKGRPLECLAEMASTLLVSLLVSGQIKLRRIAGWRKIAALQSRDTPAAA